MAVTATVMQTVFASAKTAFSGALITVRHGANVYQGLRASTESQDRASSIGAIAGATGAVRFSVADLKPPIPKSSDEIQIQEPGSDEWLDRVVLSVRYDQIGATVRLDYGEKYG